MTRIPITTPQKTRTTSSEGKLYRSEEESAEESGSQGESGRPNHTDTSHPTPGIPDHPRESDPTIPPASQPSDSEVGTDHSLGEVARETDGVTGADFSGGEITAPQDADRATQENIDTRVGEQDMWRRQVEGEVDTQTKDLKPSPSDPEHGLPGNPDGKDSASSGAPEPGESPGTEASAAPGTASTSDETVARAAAEHDERFLRAVADLENYKRAATRREQETRERATRNVIEDLLPVMDNFERALDAARNAKDIESLRVGVEFIAQQFRDVLKTYGVEPIESTGKHFDPLHHEAIEEVSGSGQPEGTVVGEAQRGYAYKGQVLRPSRVRVAGK